MTVVISMLRGVNLGSHNRVKMDALMALYASLKLRDPQTYIQSGNVIFGTKEQDWTRLANRIGNGIERNFSFRCDVVIRTASQLRSAIARNPFAARPGIVPGKLLVTFLASEPGPEARERLLRIKTDREELRIDGSELYTYYPNGVGRSKLQLAVIERALKISGTARNWTSVTKMLEMAEKLEGIP
jgi:uncharacterized protein (DUF1697 family)